METVLYSNLKKDDCVKAIQGASLQAKKTFLDGDALSMVYMAVDGDAFRAERILMVPRLFKPVFVAKLEAEGNLTRIQGEVGLSPMAKGASSVLFMGWCVLGFVISLLASGTAGFSFGTLFGLAVVLGILLFLVAPRIALAAQRKDMDLVLDYLRKALDVKGVI
jgi:hypothetical protein